MPGTREIMQAAGTEDYPVAKYPVATKTSFILKLNLYRICQRYTPFRATTDRIDGAEQVEVWRVARLCTDLTRTSASRRSQRSHCTGLHKADQRLHRSSSLVTVVKAHPPTMSHYSSSTFCLPSIGQCAPSRESRRWRYAPLTTISCQAVSNL